MDTMVPLSLTSDTAKTNQTQIQTNKVTLPVPASFPTTSITPSPAQTHINKNPVQAPVPITTIVDKQQAEVEKTLAKTVDPYQKTVNMKTQYATPARNTYLSGRKMYHNIPASSIGSISTKSIHKTSFAYSNVPRNLTKTNREQEQQETDT
jgi:hypothetical protein